MSASRHHEMTVAEFLAWEAKQELKHEFNGFDIVAMTGGTRNHAALQRNLAISVGGRLVGAPCEFFGSDFKIEVAGSIRYADGLVTCTPSPGDSTVTPAPVIIFEVLSESTAEIDRTDKMEEYRATPSIKRYVMLEQNRMIATVFAREGANWVGSFLHDGDELDLPEIGIRFPLAELYRGVEIQERRPAVG